MKRVLIIDDHASVRGLVRDILENIYEDLYVEEEENGLYALVNCECRDYDLLICDVNMPEMAGIDLIQALRRSHWSHSVPIIVLSAESDPESIARGVTCGATAYLTKPFNEQELTTTVLGLLKAN
jgi:two-component system chemotaxis response regulator CheY